MMRAARTAVVLAGLVALGGCGQDWWTSNIHETMALPSGGAIVTNADVRLVHRFRGAEREITYQRHPTDPSKTIPVVTRHDRDYVCAEPSPDIAKAVQASLALSGGAAATVTPPAGGTAVDAQLAFQTNASRSESMAQLTKRIATIQLLRDGMYRACEAYANGAIGREIYTAIVSRYDRMMITMLLAEMAAGNFGSAAILAGSSSASAAAEASVGAGGRLEAASRRQAALARELAEQEKVVAAQTGKANTAEANLQAQPNDPVLIAANKTEQAQLQAEIRIRDQIKSDKGMADDEVVAAREMAAKAGPPGASASGRTVVSSVGHFETPAASAANSVKDVAEVLHRMQRTYMNEPHGHSLLLMCFTDMSDADRMQRYQKEFCDSIRLAMLSDAGYRLAYDTTARAQLTELGNERIAALGAALKDLIGSGKMTAGQAAEILRAAGGATTPPQPRDLPKTAIPLHSHPESGRGPSR